MDLKCLLKNYYLNLLKALHEKNIMHRDFKAANIFIKNDLFKIGDFGFAK